MSWWIGVGLAGLIGLVAWQTRLLTLGGALAATLVGASVFGAGGIEASIPMVAFFLSGSLLPRALGRPHSTEQRTASQVLANGLAPMLCCWGVALYPALQTTFWLGYAASLATATADTWATEFGTRFGNPAWIITTGKRVPPGESGAVSVAGTLGGAIGAHLIAGLCIPLTGSSMQAWTAAALGVGGMLLDSLLGATLQARFHCHECGRIGEKPLCCRTPATHVRGIRWMDNNLVNLLSTLATAGAILIIRG